MITQAPRGTKDWFGKDMDQRTYLENIFKDLCASYNIHEIITPVFEHTELFQRGVGETTDVVQKEMYTFEDKGHRSISLKIQKEQKERFVHIYRMVWQMSHSRSRCSISHQHSAMKNHRVED